MGKNNFMSKVMEAPNITEDIKYKLDNDPDLASSVSEVVRSYEKLQRMKPIKTDRWKEIVSPESKVFNRLDGIFLFICITSISASFVFGCIFLSLLSMQKEIGWVTVSLIVSMLFSVLPLLFHFYASLLTSSLNDISARKTRFLSKIFLPRWRDKMLDNQRKYQEYLQEEENFCNTVELEKERLKPHLEKISDASDSKDFVLNDQGEVHAVAKRQSSTSRALKVIADNL